jgi:hypothetical protein
MAFFRVPYPKDPDQRKSLFERALSLMGRHGACQGTPEAGTFEGRTPLGRFSGSYHWDEESGEIVFEVAHKPFLVPISLIEHETRKFMGAT